MLLYGIAAYAIFFVTFLYAIGFVTGLVVPKSIDTGTVAPMLAALIVNLLLSSLALVLLFWQWQPMPAVVWQIGNHVIVMAIFGLSFVG